MRIRQIRQSGDGSGSNQENSEVMRPRIDIRLAMSLCAKRVSLINYDRI
jgi:hypothetical protein